MKMLEKLRSLFTGKRGQVETRLDCVCYDADGNPMIRETLLRMASVYRDRIAELAIPKETRGLSDSPVQLRGEIALLTDEIATLEGLGLTLTDNYVYAMQELRKREIAMKIYQSTLIGRHGDKDGREVYKDQLDLIRDVERRFCGDALVVSADQFNVLCGVLGFVWGCPHNYIGRLRQNQIDEMDGIMQEFGDMTQVPVKWYGKTFLPMTNPPNAYDMKLVIEKCGTVVDECPEGNPSYIHPVYELKKVSVVLNSVKTVNLDLDKPVRGPLFACRPSMLSMMKWDHPFISRPARGSDVIVFMPSRHCVIVHCVWNDSL